MLKRIKIICMPALFVFLLAFIPNGVFGADFDWKMSSAFPLGDTANMENDKFAKMVEEGSNGRVKITYYGGTLGSPRDAWDMVKSNTIQFTWTGDLYNPGRMPITGMVGMPFEVPTIEKAYKSLDGLLNAGYLDKEYSGLKALYLLPTYPINLYFTKKKVEKMEDFQGVKIRCGTGLQGQVLTTLGASTVSLPGSEEYMSLQTGVIDGTITGINIAFLRKLNEVVKYGMRDPIMSFGVMVMLMNEETWEKTPDDIQKIILQASKDICEDQVTKNTKNLDVMWNDFSQKVEAYTISPDEQARWRKSTGDLIEKYAEDLSAKGYPAKEALGLIRKVIAE
ncbi:MAG: TRAP transporter substrate-binding protein DctP [Deltaproteobacteria bacterium]|nr:TRAP transporter substrate-binding protein DctP [Deltaproteobacteria bacterium]